jgi:hypothetical protein
MAYPMGDGSPYVVEKGAHFYEPYIHREAFIQGFKGELDGDIRYTVTMGYHLRGASQPLEDL